MTPNQVTTCLAMLKIDLGIMEDWHDTRLSQYVRNAYERIIEEGALTLDPENMEDATLIVQYAAWTWRRRDTGEGMPRMLRYGLNNRIFREKMKEAEDG